MSRRGGLAIVAGLALAATFAPGLAFAHADLTSSNPAPNSLMSTAVTQVVLTFSEPITLVQPGVTVSNGNQTINTTPTLNDRTVTAVLATPIGAGTYDVTWNIKAADGDTQTASYSFSIAQGVVAPAATGGSAATTTTTVGASTTTSTVLVEPRDASTSTPTTTEAPRSSSTNTAQNWLIYALAAAGIVIVAVVIGGIVRLIRKRR